ncbi:hypothetical protein BZG01_07215 [Labilibaculum manganireducens]|uniref:Tetratricopeptide repeat protein n=1 Tax=Labilibaculum manganireducens TaxID=1940525 RepID=A0A2N3IB47_9BACT|nr:hypothetical protein [Labilibaculum manganireducens]PKQ67519.1 hypothetical protein BZG01_07215 [Labilibaculum manganireducens]
MKKTLLFLSLILFCGVSIAQEIFAPAFKMTKEPLLRPKIYIEPAAVSGDDIPFDIDTLLKSKFESGNWINSPRGKGLRIEKHWRDMKIYSLATSKEEADVILQPRLNYTAKSEKIDTWLHEFKGRGGVKIPFKEVRATNSLDVNIVLDLKYKDKSTSSDTISYETKSVLKKGKKLISLEEMNEKLVKQIGSQLYYLQHFAECDMICYRFPKLKIKDKELKNDIKTIQTLLNEARLSDVANIYRKIIDKEPSPEAHLCLGICYELAGDIKKAEAEFKHKIDFHIKTRMKSNNQIYDYFQSIGITLKGVEI